MCVHYVSEDQRARGFLVFQRLQRFYKTFALLNGFISVAGATALSMEEFHPTSSSLASTSEGLLCSSIITAVMSAFLVGLVCWYLDRNASWRGLLLGIQFVALTAFCIVISFSIWSLLITKGGLGKEEMEAASKKSAAQSPERQNMGQALVL
ncbi:hypothetical protein GB937_005496 [Aspergillus fischeri]|nr:hypothetical protein GB937_005496 [Aspergillus fischeri]